MTNQSLIESWFEKKNSYKRHFEDNSGNVNMGWILDNKELLFILLGITVVVWLYKKMLFLGDTYRNV